MALACAGAQPAWLILQIEPSQLPFRQMLQLLLTLKGGDYILTTNESYNRSDQDRPTGRWVLNGERNRYPWVLVATLIFPEVEVIAGNPGAALVLLVLSIIVPPSRTPQDVMSINPSEVLNIQPCTNQGHLAGVLELA